MMYDSFSVSDVGRKRGNNEDSLLVDEGHGLFIVADGMGGHENGEMASRMAIRAIHEYLKDEGIDERADIMAPEKLAEALSDAINVAAQHLVALRGNTNMGTTMTVLWLVEGRGVMAHIGDSRLYRLREDALWQVSEDHTLVGMLVKNGQLQPDQAENHPMGHVLMRSLGKEPSVEVDTAVVDAWPGDTFLLCSDGLTGYLGDVELENMMMSSDIAATGQRMVNIANERGGKDNITLILIKVLDEFADNNGNHPAQFRTPTLMHPVRAPSLDGDGTQLDMDLRDFMANVRKNRAEKKKGDGEDT